MKRIDPADIRALVARTPNWLGDSVMALPTLRSLRAALPRTHITLVGPWVELLRDQGVADRFVAYPRRIPQRLLLARVVRGLKPDTALILPNSLESALAARLWGARRRVGFATDGRGWLLTHPVQRRRVRPHQVDEYLELLKPFNLAPVETAPTWTLAPSPTDGEVSRLLEQAELPEGAALVGLHLGAAFGSSKLWPVERWASLIPELKRVGMTPVLMGSPDELRVAAEVLKRCAVPVASLVGQDNPLLLPRLLSRLTLLISGDTGVAQLAAALNVAVIALFGPTDPRLTAPRGARVSVIAKDVPCAPCFLPVCPIDHPCMRGIDTREVVAAALALSDTPV